MMKRLFTLAILMPLATTALAQTPNFGTDDVISNTTLWTFDQFQVGDVIATENGTNYAGLYIKAHNQNNPSIAESSAATSNFGDYTIYTVNNCKAAGGSSTASSFAKGSVLNTRKASDYYADCIAVNIGVPGTLYITASANNKSLVVFQGNIGEDLTDASDITLYTSASNLTTTASVHTISVTKSGTCWITASGAYNIYAIKFVPTNQANVTKKITMSKYGVMTFSDKHAWNFEGTGLNAYYLKSHSNGTLSPQTITNVIPACTGVVLVGTPNQEYTLTLSDVNSLTASSKSALDQNYTLRPVLTDYKPAAYYTTDINTDSKTWNNLLLTNGDDKMLLKPTDGTTAVSTGGAYYRIRKDQQNTYENLFLNLSYTTYTLATNVSPAETGTIVVTNNQTETTGTTFLQNTDLVLTATPVTNYALDYWSTDGTETNKLTAESDGSLKLSITENKSVYAVFKSTSAVTPTSIDGATVNLSTSSFVYNGSAQAPTVSSVVLSDNTLTLGTDYTVNDITSQTNVGNNYTITVTGTGSYEGTASATWSITQATNTLSGTLSIEGWTYGSAANLPSGVTAAFGTVAYKYSDAENGEYGTYEEKVNGTVGTWWVKAFVEGTDNYTAAESSPVSFTISSAATNASYTVEHYQQNIENDEYTKVDGDTQTINTGNAGDQTAAEAKIYEGFTAQSFDQAKIAADGSTVVKIYYTRNSYTISFNSDGGSEVAAINGKYGSTVTAPDDPTKTNCVFEGWYNGNEKYTFSKMPAQNLTLTAHWTIAESVGLTKVSTSKTWTFVNVAENTSYSSLTNFNEGLYIRANSSKTISRNTGSLNIQFSDESSETSYTVALKLSANSSFAPATTLVANDAVTNADAGCLAVTSDIPGTFYVAAKASAKDASKYVQFIFNGIATSVASDKLNATSGDGSYGCKYEYTATEAGTFVIGSTSVGVNVYCIRFEPTKYELTSSVSPENAGTITKKISGETENATETEFYKGMEIVLTATANTGYDFQKWTDGTNDLTAEEDKSLKVTMDAAKTIVANFTALEYSITYDLAGGSLAEGVTNPATYTIESDAITLSNPIKNGFTFAGWTGTGITEATTTVTIAKGSTGDRTYTATWTENASDTYSITLPATVNGNSITADVSSAAKNATVTLTIATAENYSLSTITANNGDVTLSGSGNTRTFTMPAANVTITATWTIIQTDSQDSNTSETYTVTESGGIEVSQVTSTEGATSITISSDKVGDVEVTSIADDAFNSIENKSAIKSVDLSATKITGVEVSRSSGVFRGFPEETMIYLPANNTAASGQKNVIIGGTCSDFVMKDEKSYSIPTSFIATNATLSRTFTSNAYCTLCLPYDVPASSLGGKIYEFSSIEGTTVKMTEDTDGLNANKPYIFVPNSSVGSIETSGSISVSMSNTPNTNNTDFTFKGVFGKKEFTAEEISGGVYGFAADSEHGASVGQFVKASNGAWTEGMRAYLAYSGNLSETGVATTRGEGLPEYLNVVLVSASGSTTNIGRLELMTAEDGSPVYNLNGQRVDNSYKGIVIKNGKKVIKK